MSWKTSSTWQRDKLSWLAMLPLKTTDVRPGFLGINLRHNWKKFFGRSLMEGTLKIGYFPRPGQNKLWLAVHINFVGESPTSLLTYYYIYTTYFLEFTFSEKVIFRFLFLAAKMHYLQSSDLSHTLLCVVTAINLTRNPFGQLNAEFWKQTSMHACMHACMHAKWAWIGNNYTYLWALILGFGSW
jgi:hypothetical protein